jgi:hypothetical protein
MGLEGIVSKRKDSPYRSGRSPDWLKMKNPNAPAVKREAEEDWGRKRMMDAWRRELFLISLLAAFSGWIAWVLDHELFAAAFAAAAIIAGSQSRPR